MFKSDFTRRGRLGIRGFGLIGAFGGLEMGYMGRGNKRNYGTSLCLHLCLADKASNTAMSAKVWETVMADGRCIGYTHRSWLG